ncbi:3-oxoacyl-ACP reductase [Bradyrhizobium macuxiense]|uniref:3-oxoacyl-ACP reductase n=1 Tax=Bradyrhizobium macuxiense TaxID=1755647 RepID=A0A109JAX2_9BRAD|nr:SDR family NAD(P)-dependent oxidoreductase [Bradyrhizobium macuxiense]KWV45566.1 3-oxoacyl-ACP reductase [Bradyrhizobium macuxiense]
MTGALTGRRALVTGGASGIGAAIARAFVREGAQATILDRDRRAGEAMVGEYELAFIEADVADTENLRACIAAAGSFDILVNSAGVDQHAFFTATSPPEWRRWLAINLEAVFATTHAVLPAMQAARFGRLINIASEAGRRGSRGGSVYAAAKGGVIAFTKSMALENARYGITANVIAPGPIDTPMLRRAVAAGGERLLEGMKGATLLQRLGTPDEVAAAAVFLASDAAGYITGETLGVSGGMGIGT